VAKNTEQNLRGVWKPHASTVVAAANRNSVRSRKSHEMVCFRLVVFGRFHHRIRFAGGFGRCTRCIREQALRLLFRYRATARQPQEVDLSAGHIGFRTTLNPLHQ
jgi:hypothetical protein